MQGGYRVDHGLVGDFIPFDIGDGTGKVAFLGATVPDDDCLGKHLRIIVHLHVDNTPVAHFDGLLHHAYIGKFQSGFGWHLNGILSVNVRNDTVGSTLLQYGRSDERFSCSIGHRTGHRLVLRETGSCCEEQTCYQK